MTFTFDPKAVARAENPFPVFARLREEDPVHWNATLKGWVLTRYDDVRRALRAPEYSSDRLRPFFDNLPPEEKKKLADLGGLIPLWLVFRNPPDHTRLRSIMNPAFVPGAMARMREGITVLVDELIDRFADRGTVEFIREFALALPGNVICDLLGLPRSDLARLKSWSDELQLFIGGSKVTAGKYERAERGTHEMAQYFREVIRERRRQPGSDLVSTLIAARDEKGGLTEDELVATCILMLFGGHETTSNLLGNGMLSFLRHPGELAKLRAEPALAASAIEECLRYDGPGGYVVRVVAEDHELGGKTLLKGQRVFAMVPAANRDPARFPDPDRFDIRRSDNPHLTFGQGPHFCLGAPLARAEALAALPRVFERLENVKIAVDQLEWRDATIMRGVETLPLSFVPACRVAA